MERMWQELDALLPHTTAAFPLNGTLSWFQMFVRLGQHHQLQPGDEMGPQSFGLGEEFDLSRKVRFSVHLAMNLTSLDPDFSMFWNRQELGRWCQGENTYMHYMSIKCNQLCFIYVPVDPLWTVGAGERDFVQSEESEPRIIEPRRGSWWRTGCWTE
jgi:hypothetical protein